MLSVEEFPAELIIFFNDFQEILKCSKQYIFNTYLLNTNHTKVYHVQQPEPEPIGGFLPVGWWDQKWWTICC